MRDTEIDSIPLAPSRLKPSQAPHLEACHQALCSVEPADQPEGARTILSADGISDDNRRQDTTHQHGQAQHSTRPNGRNGPCVLHPGAHGPRPPRRPPRHFTLSVAVAALARSEPVIVHKGKTHR